MVKIYPNPTSGKFNLDIFLNEPQNLQLRIFNILGQNIFAEEYKYIFDSAKHFNLSLYVSGIYDLQLISKEGIINKKLIIK